MNCNIRRLTSVFVIFAMMLSLISFPVSAQTQGEDLFEKFKDVAIYTLASSQGDIKSGVGVLSTESDSAYNSNLYSVDDKESYTSAGITEDTVSAAKAAGAKYVTLSKDGAWKYSSAVDSKGVEKEAWFTTKNYRQSGSSKSIGGNIYFGLTDSSITVVNKDLTFLIEYLDAGTSAFKLRYCIGGNTTSTANITRTNTGEWKTAVISVTDAALSSVNSGTGLGSGKEDFRIEAASSDTYISRMMVVKTNDYLGEEKEILKPEEDMTRKIFLIGSSSCETLAPSYFPREGWGMELPGFFTDEVIFVNKSKGGKSTRTFLSGHDPTAGENVYDTRMQDILDMAHEGDYLFINLGSNDANNGRDSVKTDPYILSDNGDGTSYRANLVKFVEIAKQNKLIPIFITPSRVRKFNSDGTVADDGVEAHRTAMTEVGQQQGVPVLDLGSAHKELMQSLGKEDSKLIFMHTTETEYPNLTVSRSDDAHINQTGAKELSKLIVKLIAKGAEEGDETLAGLYNYVDKTKDLSPITKPVYQNYIPNYDVSDVKYTVNGEESDVYYAGEVGATLTVKNNGKISDTATMYLAVYDENGSLTDVSASLPVTIAPGESAQLTADAVTLPDLDGISFRKYVWSSALKPYSQAPEAKINLFAQGYNRKAVLNWTEYEELGDDITFEIYRDGYLLDTTSKGAYIDEDVTRGEHSYQINALDSKGSLVYQTGCAIVNVTSMDDVDSSVVYTKAHLNMNGEEEDINKGINCHRTSKLYPSQYSQYYYGDLSDELYAKIINSGVAYTHAGSDGPVIVKKVTDDYGITKDAWFTTKSYCYTEKREGKEIKDSFMYFKVMDKSITPEDKNLTVFVDYFANRSSLTLGYCNAVIEGETITQGTRNVSVGDVVTNGWRTAKFELNDAYFDQISTTYFNGTVDMRLASNGSDLYVSSIVIVKGTGNEALKKYASLLPGFSNNVSGVGSAKYPDGVSIDFSSGTPVMNGIRSFRREDNKGADASSFIACDEDGEYYVTTQQVLNSNGTAKQTYLYFGVDDEYMFGINDNSAQIELTYKAEYDTQLNWLSYTYNPETGEAGTSTIKKIAQLSANPQDPWQTIRFSVDNIAFDNLDNGGCDFRLAIPANPDDANKQLKVRKLVIKNANATDRNIFVNDEEVKIYIAAASTAASYDATSPILGWGMKLSDHTSAQIVNYAKPGSSTDTFPNMGAILDSVQPGDYVFMQFGHNDSMLDDPRGVEVEQYKINLSNFVKSVRQKHAVPVILTSIPRFSVSDGILLHGGDDAIEPYRQAASEVASELDVACIDTAGRMAEYTKDMTSDEIEAMFCDEGYNNRVHLTEPGAACIACVIADGIMENEKINVLKDYMK